MGEKSGLNLQAESVAEVDPACVAAFNQFIDNMDRLANVRLHMHAAYDAALNRARDSEKGTGGPRLVFSFGDPDRADAVTNWTFLFPNLSGKASKARSLHYRKDGSADVAGGTREAVECATGDPRLKKEGVDRLREPARELLSRSARMVNSMSFGCLFGDPVDGLGNLIDKKDVFDIRKAPGLSETASHRRAMMALVGGVGRAAGLQGEERVNAVAGIYAGLSGVLDGQPYAGLDPENPLDKMMAWQVLARRYEMAGALRQAGPAGGGLPAQAADTVEAAMLAADGAGFAPDPVGLAYRAMGLSSLYGALDKIDNVIAGEGCNAEGTDLGHFLGSGGLQGLLYLSAYKEIQDHGAGYVPAEGLNGRASSVSVLKAGNAPNVYYKLCRARAEQELRSRGFQEPPKGRAYPKTLSGGMGPEQSRGVERHVSYRFLRSIATGEDPELASRAPLGRAYIGASERGGAGPVLCDIEGCPKGLRLADLMAGKHGGALSGLPVLESLGQDGYGSAVVASAREVLSKNGGSADILALEMGAFLEMRGADGPLGRFEKRLSAMESDFLARQRGGPLEAGVPTTYYFALKHSSGYPSMKYGTIGMGDGIVAEASALAPEACRSREIYPWAFSRGGPDACRAARSFRALDYGRQACVDAYGKEPDSGWFGFLEGHSAFRKAQGDVLDACAGASDGWAANDALVLADCYGLWSENDMEALKQDVLDINSNGLYRPASKTEADALRLCYGYGSSQAARPPRVGFEVQGTAAGLAAALEPAFSADPLLRLKVADMLEAASLDEGTLAKDPYGGALRILEPPRKEIQEIRTAVDKAQLEAALGSPMEELISRNEATDRALAEAQAGDRDVSDG